MSDSDDRSPVSEEVTELRAFWSQRFDLVRRFFHTRRAIHRGTPLFDWSAVDREAAGYLGPWKFNAIETAVTGGVAAVTVNLAHALGNSRPAELQGFGTIDPALEPILRTILGWLEPFAIPVTLTAVVYLMGWGTLRRRDSTFETRRRARFVYLYCDGAYGLYVQLFLALAASFSSTEFGQRTIAGNRWGCLSIALFYSALILASLWQTLQTTRKIPRLVFVANGYSDRLLDFWQRPQPTDPPWTKFSLAFAVGAGPIAVGIPWLIQWLSFGLAWLLNEVRALLL
jgi:hypothetical protein